MEAPDKIYLPEEPFKDGNSETCWNYKPIGGIEYIRTDVAIKVLVAEIERRRKDWSYGSSIEAKYKREECDDILSFLNNLEVKEISSINLKKEVDYPSFDESQETPIINKCKEHKFEKGNWIVGNKVVCQILAIYIGGYIVDKDNCELFIPFEDEELYHLWTIEDAKKGNVLIYNGIVKYSNEIKYKRICLFNNLDNAFFTLTRTSNCIEDYAINVNIDYPNNTVPATKEQKEILFMTMDDAGYEFDFEKKELKKINQKPYGQRKECLDCQFNYAGECKGSCAMKRIEQKTFLQKCFNAEYERGKNDAVVWNEEDDKLFNLALDMIEWYSGKNEEKARKVSDWLKSLKIQNK